MYRGMPCKKGRMPVKIDVTELMNHRSDAIRFDYTFDPRHTDVECVELPPDSEFPTTVSGSPEKPWTVWAA